MTIFQPDRHLLLKFMTEHAPKFQGFVLDVGGGTGRYRGLFPHVVRYAVLDPDASKHADIVAGAEDIPLEDGSVDGIVCTQVLGDVWDVELAVREMVRVLKPGGLLLVTESAVAELHDEPHDYWRVSGETLSRLFGDGCEVLVLEQRGGYHALQAQQGIRYLIGRYNLYERPLLGRVAHCYALLVGHVALYRDRRAKADDDGFAIGYNLLARKKG